MNVNKSEIKSLIEDAIDKAREDDRFKKELIINPLVAISTLRGENFRFADGKKLVFIDTEETPLNTDSTYYININTYGDLEDMELTQEQLETIAGGTEDLPLPFPFPIIIRL